MLPPGTAITQLLSQFTESSPGGCALFTKTRGLQANLMCMSRVDMHVHSTASQLSKLGVQRALGLPECATRPQEVYEQARARGMDFVTITDHDTIAGALEIAELPGAFISEELTAWFKGEPQAVHVLCYGISAGDHEWLQAHNDDVETCAAYLAEHEITCALAHPFYAVEAPLTPRHRRRLAELFPIWETRNGSRAKELNLPAFVYIETHGGTGIGGSDDHAGLDIGRTYTETPWAGTVAQFLGHVREGRAVSGGKQGGAAKWAHAAMAIAVRALGRGECAQADPARVLTIVQRVLAEGDARRGALGTDLSPADARALLLAWLRAVDLDMSEPRLLELLLADDFDHADLYRRARRVHERKLAAFVQSTMTAVREDSLDPAAAAAELFDACIAAIPYAPATAFLGREKAKLVTREGERPRVALVADGVGSMHGVTHTLDEIRSRGVPGFEIEVIGTDPNVDRRLSAVAEVDIPFYAGLEIGVPSLPAIVETLAEGRYDLVHLVSPGPTGVAACLLAKMMEIPVVGSYHTELAAYAELRSQRPQLGALTEAALGAFYGACGVVLSPSGASDARLGELGIPAERIARWDRGVDVARFDPARRVERMFPGEVNVLYAGRMTREKGVDLLCDAFLRARARDPRLHLVLAGGGPEESVLRERLGSCATFLGWLEGDALADAYASADAFLFASRTDTFGQVLLEAQASGLPVVAVAEGGPTALIEHGVSGMLCEADADALADALLAALGTELHARLAGGGREAARGRTWEAALGRLGAGYRAVLELREGAAARRAA
jgi:glycosyltransferase involved in cell wall biosynthesis/predicted metal-dependent phosphoesterase TrpH